MFLANNLNKGGSSGGYQISRSLRFNSADSAYLNRTPASASNRKTWTFSAWVKRSKAGDFRTIFSAATDTSNLTIIRFKDDDKIEVRAATAGSTVFQLVTTQVFRDYSAWYHFVLAVDTTNATGGDRVRLYVNGSEVTAFDTDTNPTQNADGWVNNNILHEIGRQANNASYYYQDGYMTEIYLIDGSQLTPSSFGETNTQTGVWQPKAYSGSYGTNGFYLNFSDNSNTTAATLGKDYSGNGNNWTPNNFSVTAGVGNDSMVDTPTPYGTDTGAGGSVRGNYCTLNALQKGSTVNIANGNLDVSNSTSGGAGKILGTIGVSSGKWYAEATMSGSGGMPGISEFTANLSQYPGGDAQSWGYNNGGQKYHNGSGVNYGATFTTNDVIGIALDMDTGSITFYKNNVSQGVAYNTGIAGKTIAFAGRGDTTTTESWNFGQRPFAYTAPSGFKALCTQNLPTPTIGATTATQADRFFTPNLWSGNDGVQAINNNIDTTNGGGWIWFKARNLVVSNFLINSNSGYTKYLASNTTAAEDTFNFGFTPSTGGFSFNSSSGSVNQSGYTYVAWQWKAGGTAVSNTSGSITSTVSANTTSGFSVVTYTGNGIVGATVGHGLGVAPSMMFIKGRSNVDNWHVYSSALGNTGGMFLNLTNAFTVSSFFWNNTSPSSTVFTLSSGSSNNSSGVTYVAYCFAEVAGYSKFGSYTGNGSADGPFVFCGFRPAYVMYKGSSASGGAWDIHDDARSPRNVAVQTLFANTSGAEGGIEIDILSNGFKVRDTSANVNSSGVTYIFAAFAEAPQKFALAR